jgi:hypothetical protein
MEPFREHFHKDQYSHKKEPSQVHPRHLTRCHSFLVLFRSCLVPLRSSVARCRRSSLARRRNFLVFPESRRSSLVSPELSRACRRSIPEFRSSFLTNLKPSPLLDSLQAHSSSKASQALSLAELLPATLVSPSSRASRALLLKASRDRSAALRHSRHSLEFRPLSAW